MSHELSAFPLHSAPNYVIRDLQKQAAVGLGIARYSDTMAVAA
jgi:hypothetical protein